MINIKRKNKYHPLKQMFRIRKYGNANKREEEEEERRRTSSAIRFTIFGWMLGCMCTMYTAYT